MKRKNRRKPLKLIRKAMQNIRNKTNGNPMNMSHTTGAMSPCLLFMSPHVGRANPYTRIAIACDRNNLRIYAHMQVVLKFVVALINLAAETQTSGRKHVSSNFRSISGTTFR